MRLDYLGSLQLKVMRVFWREGDKGLSPREIYSTFEKDQYAYTTILTVCRMLHTKMILKRRKKGKTHLYYARVSFQQYKEWILDKIQKELFDDDKEAMESFLQKQD